MAQREPKSLTTTTITVVGRDGRRKGRLEITSGNLTYYRQSATDWTQRWTLQQLVEVLENEIASQAAAEKTCDASKSTDRGDLVLQVDDTFGKVVSDDMPIIVSSYRLRELPHGTLDGGAYQLIDPRSLKKKVAFPWTASIGMRIAIYMLDMYVDKYLMKKKGASATDENVPVSRDETMFWLRRWLVKLRSV
jgi:hypothetical protein